jgi:hypothetical protein
LVRNASKVVLTGGALAAALLLLIFLPLSTASATQPQMLFRPMTLPATTCPPNTAQRFDQDDDGTGRFLDVSSTSSILNGTMMVPSVFAGRQAWLILNIENENPDSVGGASNELHELFLTNGNRETIFLGVIDESKFITSAELVFQIPQDFLTAGMNNLTLQLDEVVNQDPNVIDFSTPGDIKIDSMRVCYGGYFVYEIPLTCGFTPVDLNATGAPTYRAPAIKQGDYGTNILIRNPDGSLPTMLLSYSLYVEFVTTVPIGLPAPITNVLVNTTFPAGVGTLAAMTSNFTSCDSLMELVRSRTNTIDPRVLLFWKGTLIITQPIGNGTTQTKLPLNVQAVYSYELTVNKIWFQILKDPSRTIPRHLIGQDLEMIIALSPANKTNLAGAPFESFQTMRAIRENIGTQWGAAVADRAIIRVVEVNVGVGSSQSIARVQPTETPLESP